MSAQPAEEHGLAQAQQRIDALLDELNATVEIAGFLANTGDDESALALIDRQRRHLSKVVADISKDVGTGPRPLIAQLRRRLPLVAAAIVASLSCAAASFVAFRSTPADDLNSAREALRQASIIADPSERLGALLDVYDKTASLPTGLPGADEVRNDLARVVNGTPVPEPNPRGKSLQEWASDVVDGADEGEAPSSPPDPDRDVDETVQTVKDLLG